MTQEKEQKQINKIEHDVYVSLRDHIHALMQEQQRATEQATAEREKAAQVLRESTLHQIKTGDSALERHIQEQVQQLRQLIESQIDLVNQAKASSREAILKAETASEKRFESVNEFRQTLSDQAARLMPRDEYTARHEALEKEISQIVKDRVDSTEELGKFALREAVDPKMSMIETQIARLYGGLAVIAFLGIANLVKVWFIH